VATVEVISTPVADLTQPLKESVDPTATVAAAGAMLMLLTAVELAPAPTVMVLLLDRVPILAVTMATPFRTPVTTPVLDTVATVVSLEESTTREPKVAVISAPVDDLMVPLRVMDAPTATDAVAGDTVMLLARLVELVERRLATDVSSEASSPGLVESVLEHAAAAATSASAAKERWVYMVKPSKTPFGNPTSVVCGIGRTL